MSLTTQRPAPEFFVETAFDADRYVVRVHGEVDVATADALRTVVFEALESTSQLVIDLERTSFLDSSGLTVFVGASRLRDFDPEAITIRNANSSIRKVLQITGVDQIIRVA